MTATAPAAAPAPAHPLSRPLRQATALAVRSIRGVRRQVPVLFPALVFPLIFTAMNSAAFERATNLPQFPQVESFLAFLLPAAVMQGVIFGSLNAGSEIASDVAGGFFDRLVASPVSRLSILLGRLAGAGVLGIVQVVWFLAVLVPFGATMESGLVGVAVYLLAGSLTAMAIGGFAIALGLRTGSAEAVQAAFPLMFILLFTSSAFFPRELMTGWYQDVATYNPVSWLVEALRGLSTAGFDVGDAAVAVLVPVGIGVLSLSLALAALRRRVRGST